MPRTRYLLPIALYRVEGPPSLLVVFIETFTFTQTEFRRIVIKHLGHAGDASVLLTKHCGRGVERAHTPRVCPVLGRGTDYPPRTATRNYRKLACYSPPPIRLFLPRWGDNQRAGE